MEISYQVANLVGVACMGTELLLQSDAAAGQYSLDSCCFEGWRSGKDMSRFILR